MPGAMFYDLNLNLEGLQEQCKREIVSRAMELGYVSIAVSHMVTRIMADSDRCRIQPLTLKNLLAATPGMADSARFHREVLGVPIGVPFRQYSRMTVVVEDAVQASALNSANPVLRTYDLIAVQPTNQKLFIQACNDMEVDIISFDFSQKLPFRIKFTMVKTAMERGIFFEINYAAAIFDTRARKDLFSNTQMLIGITRGKNIIVSSGARVAMELRGPNDVANMSTLFGLSIEQARVAVSQSCKSALLHGIARKKTFKAAILIEKLQPDKELTNEKSLFDVPEGWDPLSTGAADCFLPFTSEDSKKQQTTAGRLLTQPASDADNVAGAKPCPEDSDLFIPLRKDTFLFNTGTKGKNDSRNKVMDNNTKLDNAPVPKLENKDIKKRKRQTKKSR